MVMGGVATGPRSHSPSMPMADHFTQDAVAFTCLIGEAALIEGASLSYSPRRVRGLAGVA